MYMYISMCIYNVYIDIYTYIHIYVYIYVYIWPRYIQGTCATSGEGLYEGLDWLSAQLEKVK